ncbi:RabGAP/TBC [Suhomyces tanzawaensis NRRL Y-17324]|uniref:RabGAP/TBC n=1 Tax=Suhomyces tanzawaensis NRRL Y-17324 TaxID=984487 RepID=A0A1E4SFP0_9ASCO|nr:RabGAP/TBC [Suhomyces tanzawaensis NRRL Y-17324]ODV78328.1 RabGAP/TBC [Suhomyces tanzawaensis NRRL Y-17324]
MSNRQKKQLLLSEVELLYVKSKVYLHPTTSKRDNIVGFLSLSRGPNSTNKDILLSFTPENQLSLEEIKQYNAVDVGDISLDLQTLSLGGTTNANSKASSTSIDRARVVPKPHTSVLSGYSFSTNLSFIYSIQVRKPSSGFWFGSVVINTKDGEKLPIVFFHDNESPSTLKNQKVLNQRMDPFGEDGEVYWGGRDFMGALQKFINTERSTIEPSVYLVNPDSTDLRNFAPFKDKNAPVKKEEPFKLPEVNKFLAAAKWKVLETVATFSAKAKNQVLDMVDEHAPTPIKQIISQPEVQKIGEDFDSARVYLAKWAQQVKDEAEQSQKKFMLDDDIYNKINKELGSSELLTSQEINKTSRRNEITKVEWESFFDYSGRLSLTVNEVKSRIFHGGVSDSVRGEVWLFLLEVYPWDSSAEERQVLVESYETAYEELKLKWVNDEEKRQTDYWKDQKHRIEKDIQRTDRNLPIFQNQKKRRVTVTSMGSNVLPTTRESSPETPDEDEANDDDEYDVSNITNPHLYKMREILITYNEYNENLGYVQGMTDLLSPLYVKFQHEALTFWAFTKFMDRMERNFVRDQSGMKKQMTTLNKLLQFMLPNLYKHLEKCESIDLFFFFRMLLVWFKRELEWDQVLRLWEILWTDYYTSQHHLFFALAILSDNERIIVQNLTRFDEVLKYMNDLSMKLHLNPLLIRSELLFLKFKRMIDIIDRENSLKKVDHTRASVTNDGIIEIGEELRGLLRKEVVIQKEVTREEGMGGG